MFSKVWYYIFSPYIACNYPVVSFCDSYVSYTLSLISKLLSFYDSGQVFSSEIFQFIICSDVLKPIYWVFILILLSDIFLLFRKFSFNYLYFSSSLLTFSIFRKFLGSGHIFVVLVYYLIFLQVLVKSYKSNYRLLNFYHFMWQFQNLGT